MANQLDALQSMLQTLGGTTRTTSAGDTGALQSTMTQLQGTDYTKLLESIFQQAGGQIPGLQAAFGNAIGARSGGNSAVQAALQKLLAQTTLQGQKQIADQQAQNLQTQANVGANIAQATKGTKQTDKTNIGEAAKVLALMQGMQKLGVFKALGMDSGEQGSGAATTSATPAPVNMAYTPFSQQDTSSISSEFSPFSASSAQPGYDFTPSVDLTGGGSQELSNPFDAPIYQAPELTNPFTDSAPPSAFEYFGGNEQLPQYDFEIPQFADGGLITGRGGKTAAMEPNDTPMAETAEEEGEARSNARFDAGFTANAAMDTFRKLLSDQGIHGYADGGIVTQQAGGGRRSSATDVQTIAPLLMAAINNMPAVQAAAPQQQTTPSATQLNPMRGGSGSGGNSPGFNNNVSADARNAIGKLGALNTISGATGGFSVPGGLVSALSGLAGAKSNEDALKTMGTAALSSVSPIGGAVASLAMNPTKEAAMDLGLSIGVPGYGLAAGVMGLLGLASPREVAVNAMELANPNQMMSPEQQAMAATGVANPNSAGLTGQANSMEGDALSNLISITDAFGTGRGGNHDFGGGFGDRGPGGSSGDTGASEGGASASGPGGYKNGGPINGKGTGTSDSILIKGSDGEYIMSADTVEALGVDFFDELQAAFHTPVAQLRA